MTVTETLGAVAGAAAQGPMGGVAAILDKARGIIGMFKLDPSKKADIEAQLTIANLDMEKAELAAQVDLLKGQLEINKQEAASTQWFVAGWRPFVGWTCGGVLAYSLLLQPFAQFILAAFHVKIDASALPTLNVETILTLLVPMLGIGTLRTIEKVQGAESNR